MTPKDGTSANLNYLKHPFRLSVDEVKNHLGTDLDIGLRPANVKDIRSRCGENKLAGQGGVQWYAVLLKQVSNAMILVCIDPRPMRDTQSTYRPSPGLDTGNGSFVSSRIPTVQILNFWIDVL